MIFGIVSLLLLGIVDTFFISMLGTTQLAAISFAIPIYMVFISMAMGIGMALGSITSRLIGAHKHEQAARFITDTQIFAAIFAVIISALGYQFIGPLFRALGASDEVMPFISGYMSTLLFGVPMVMLVVIGNNAFRALGNVKASAIFSAILSLLNMVLDPLFIFGIGPFPELGMQGAALATVIAALLTWIGSFYTLGFREKMLVFVRPELAHFIANWRELMTIGVPAVFANLMTPFAATIMMAIIARFGSEAVAGLGVGSRIESLSLIVVFALSSTLPMFIGQNIGAGRKDRVHQALMSCLRFTVVFQTAVFILLLLCSSFIATSFSDNKEVIDVIKTFLLILPVTYGAHGVVILIMVSLNVLQRPRTALFITIIRLAILYLPLAYIGAEIWGVTGLFCGAACGNIIAGFVAFRIIKQVCKEQGVSADAMLNAAPQYR